jgi:glycerol-3-phosphate acyltransferase PlsY
MMTLLVAVGSYALGCFSTAYYLFRFSTGADIRTQGSGNAGAKNIGRQLGTAAFIVTFLCDLSKGIAAVWLARYLESGTASVTLAMLAVVIGHIWPAQLGFRGGKGVATALGALIAFDYRLLMPSILLFGVSLSVSRNFTMSGLVAITVTPIVAVIFRSTTLESIGLWILAGIILFAHRNNLRDFLANISSGATDIIHSLRERRQ